MATVPIQMPQSNQQIMMFTFIPQDETFAPLLEQLKHEEAARDTARDDAKYVKLCVRHCFDGISHQGNKLPLSACTQDSKCSLFAVAPLCAPHLSLCPMAFPCAGGRLRNWCSGS